MFDYKVRNYVFQTIHHVALLIFIMLIFSYYNNTWSWVFQRNLKSKIRDF